MSQPRENDAAMDEASEAAEGAPRRGRLAWLRDVFRMSGEKSEPRVGLVILGFSVLFIAITTRLVLLATLPNEQVGLRRATATATSAARPDDEVRQKISAVQERLVMEYGYDEHSAREALNYVTTLLSQE